MSQDEHEGTRGAEGAGADGPEEGAPDPGMGDSGPVEGHERAQEPLESAPASEPADDAPPLPSLPQRLLQVFVSPGQLMSTLAARPAWATALILASVLIMTQTALIPWEVVESFQREAALQRGQTPPEIPENVAQIMRIATPIFAGIAVAVLTFVFAGVFTLLFAFILGDEGRYKQYLSVTAHANLIPAIVGLALVPLKISEQNPQFTLNLGSFFFFLPEGYPLRVLTMMDLSQIWSMLVVAVGATAIDARRSFASGAVILLLVVLVMAMIFATFVPTV